MFLSAGLNVRLLSFVRLFCIGLLARFSMNMKLYFIAANMLFLTSAANSAWAVEVSDQLEVAGAAELEYGANRGTEGNEYGTAISKAEFGAAIKPNDKLEARVKWLYEEDLKAVSTPLEVDEANAIWHVRPENKLDITAGKKYLKFGSFDTNMVSDPLTLDLGETRQDKVLEVTSKQGNFNTTGYVFSGTAPKIDGTGKHKSGYGFSVGYESEKVNAGVDYLSNLAESKAFVDHNSVTKKVPAMALYASTSLGGVALKAEHLTAVKSFQAGDLEETITSAAKPSATHIEADLDLKKERVLALSANKTSNAEEIGLPKNNYGITYAQPLYKNISGGIELARAKNYDATTDKSLTMKLSYEF